jgi:hypothetical protein
MLFVMSFQAKVSLFAVTNVRGAKAGTTIVPITGFLFMKPCIVDEPKLRFLASSRRENILG